MHDSVSTSLASGQAAGVFHMIVYSQGPSCLGALGTYIKHEINRV